MSAKMSPSGQRRVGAPVLAAVILGLAACGSSGSASAPTTAAPATTGTAITTTTVGPTGTADPAATAAALDLHGRRYCEILLVQPDPANVKADVYNTYPVNDCPADAWAAIDTKAIAAAEGVPIAITNGPRYWLMDRVEQTSTGPQVTKVFGGIEMIKRASVEVGPLADAMKPYTPRNVNRSTVFSFNEGATVYELHAADGSTWVMQTWSQQVDPALVEADLAGIGPRLKLPAGWTFKPRQLTSALKVVTKTSDARVLQDDLKNSYSQETAS